jgi:hypothetical protein
VGVVWYYLGGVISTRAAHLRWKVVCKGFSERAGQTATLLARCAAAVWQIALRQLLGEAWPGAARAARASAYPLDYILRGPPRGTLQSTNGRIVSTHSPSKKKKTGRASRDTRPARELRDARRSLRRGGVTNWLPFLP